MRTLTVALIISLGLLFALVSAAEVPTQAVHTASTKTQAATESTKTQAADTQHVQRKKFRKKHSKHLRILIKVIKDLKQKLKRELKGAIRSQKRAKKREAKAKAALAKAFKLYQKYISLLAVKSKNVGSAKGQVKKHKRKLKRLAFLKRAAYKKHLIARAVHEKAKKSYLKASKLLKKVTAYTNTELELVKQLLKFLARAVKTDE